MANSNDPVDALRKSLNAYVVSQDAIVKASQEIKVPEAPTPTAPPAEPGVAS